MWLKLTFGTSTIHYDKKLTTFLLKINTLPFIGTNNLWTGFTGVNYRNSLLTKAKVSGIYFMSMVSCQDLNFRTTF